MLDGADGDEESGQNQPVASGRSAALPPLLGQTPHTCTDVVWVPIFLAALGVFACVACYAFREGDVRRVWSGSDYQGRVCGLDENVTELPYLFWCRPAPGQASSPTSHGSPICVSECPESKETRHHCKDPDLAWLTEIPDYPTRRFVDYCMPKNRTKAKEALKRLVGTPFGGRKKELMSLKHFWLLWLVFSPIAAGLVAYAYLVVIINGHAEFVVKSIIAFLVAAPMIFGCVLWYNEYRSGWFLIVLALVLCFQIRQHMAEINRATDMIDWSCECLAAESSLLGLPLTAALIKAAVLLVILQVGMLLVSCGITSPNGGIHREIELTPELQLALAYCVFTMLWLFEFTNSMSHYVLAWSTEQWYFTPYEKESPDKKPDIPFLIGKGFRNAFKYHVGTLALGSLLGIFWPVQVFLQICIILPFEKCRRMLHKNVYIEVAMNSTKYSIAAADFRATVTSDSHCMNGIQLIFQFWGVLAVTLVGCALSALTLVGLMATGNELAGKFQVDDAKLVVFCAGATSLFIGWCFMNVFDTVGDTMLYCFEKEKALLDDQVDDRHGLGWCLFGSEDGGGLFGWAFGGDKTGTDMGAADFSAEGDIDCELEERVYAPPALREFLPANGRHVVRVQPAREARGDED